VFGLFLCVRRETKKETKERSRQLFELWRKEVVTTDKCVCGARISDPEIARNPKLDPR
jgi:hypothetical protein